MENEIPSTLHHSALISKKISVITVYGGLDIKWENERGCVGEYLIESSSSAEALLFWSVAIDFKNNGSKLMVVFV